MSSQMPTQDSVLVDNLSPQIPFIDLSAPRYIFGEDWTVERRGKHALRRISRMRSVAVAGGMGPDRTVIDEKGHFVKLKRGSIFNWPRFSHTVSGELACTYGRLTWTIPTEEMRESLLGYLSAKEDALTASLRKRLHLAKTKAAGAVFDAVVELCFDGVSLRRGLDDAWCRARLLIDKTVFYDPPPSFLRALCLGLAEEGDHWFVEMRNSRKRKRSPIDECALVLARNWCNADCPLFLMGRGALLKACEAISMGLGWTTDILDGCLRRKKLTQNGRPLIHDVVLDKSGRIEGYIVDRVQWMDGKELSFDWSFDQRSSLGSCSSYFVRPRGRYT